jgi:hypothetical protein
MVLKGLNPVHAVLGTHLRFNDTPVIVARPPSQRAALLSLHGLLRPLRLALGLAAPFPFVYGVRAMAQELAGSMRQCAGTGEARAGLGGAATRRRTESHLAPLAGRRGEPEHPTRGAALDAEHEPAAVRMVAILGQLHLAARELADRHSAFLSASLSANSGRGPVARYCTLRAR